VRDERRTQRRGRWLEHGEVDDESWPTTATKLALERNPVTVLRSLLHETTSRAVGVDPNREKITTVSRAHAAQRPTCPDCRDAMTSGHDRGTPIRPAARPSRRAVEDTATDRSPTALAVTIVGPGAAGIALLHIERAYSGHGTWATVPQLGTRRDTRSEVSAADNTGLYLGAPAVCFALHAAGADNTPRYESALALLDTHLTRLARRRVQAANARIDRGEAATFTEYDLFYGLTGIGQLLLQRAPGQWTRFEQVWTYLVRLTQPLRIDSAVLRGGGFLTTLTRCCRPLAGTQTSASPTASPALSRLLSARLRRGISVDWQHNAILLHLRSSRRLETTRAHRALVAAVDHPRRAQRRPPQHSVGPPRPSWCYGTPGIARAQTTRPRSPPATAHGNPMRSTPWPRALPIRSNSSRSPIPVCATAGPGRTSSPTPRRKRCTHPDHQRTPTNSLELLTQHADNRQPGGTGTP